MRKGKGTFPELRGEITRARLELADLAEEMNARSREPDYPGKPVTISVNALRDRFKLRTAWKMEDAVLICDVLGLPYENIPLYFFDPPEVHCLRRPKRHRDGRDCSQVEAAG